MADIHEPAPAPDPPEADRRHFTWFDKFTFGVAAVVGEAVRKTWWFRAVQWLTLLWAVVMTGETVSSFIRHQLSLFGWACPLSIGLWAAFVSYRIGRVPDIPPPP